jgi:hypothetical protein
MSRLFLYLLRWQVTATLELVDEGTGRGIAKVNTRSAPKNDVCGSELGDFDITGRKSVEVKDGQDFMTFTVSIVNDGYYELPDEHFTLKLVDSLIHYLTRR